MFLPINLYGITSWYFKHVQCMYTIHHTVLITCHKKLAYILYITWRIISLISSKNSDQQYTPSSFSAKADCGCKRSTSRPIKQNYQQSWSSVIGMLKPDNLLTRYKFIIWIIPVNYPDKYPHTNMVRFQFNDFTEVGLKSNNIINS